MLFVVKIADFFVKSADLEKFELECFEIFEMNISIELIEKFRAGGVHIIALPLHCNQKL